jgi:hypothetical protein
MDFPVYTMQMILSNPVIDWIAETAQQYGVHPTVVVNALLMYGMYEMATQGEEGMAKLSEFIQAVNTSTPVPVEEDRPW